MSLIAIDHLKLVVAMHGHTSGDAVLALTANAIQQSIGDGDVCARLGQDQFMVFSPKGGVTHARDTVNRALAELSRREMMLGGVKVTLSVGIAAHVGADRDFSRMYRNADVALNYARVEGKVALASKLRLR